MFEISKNSHLNYLCEIVKLPVPRKHSNADRLQCVSISGNNCITGLEARENDLCVFFPLECTISKEFLSYTNEFKDPLLNADQTKKGYFEANGRVKAVKFRGERCEGYIVPVSSLEQFARDVLKEKLVVSDKHVGTTFDFVLGHKLSSKYIPPIQRKGSVNQKKTNKHGKKYESKLVEGQFAFHEDTATLLKNIWKLQPTDYISVTEKLHGSNFIVSRVLCKRKLTLREKVAKFLGCRVVEVAPDVLYASRTIIKNKNFVEQGQKSYYDCDVWKIVSDCLSQYLSEGETVYGEIVGYTPTGRMIQKGYDYSVEFGKTDFYIFKITHTDSKGKVRVYNHRETEAWCLKNGVKMVPIHYYGQAGGMFPNLDTENHWHQNFIQRLSEAFLEKECSMCKNKVPAEGVVLRIDSPFEWEVYKLKSFLFKQRESKMIDAGETSVEDEEVAQAEAEQQETTDITKS